MHDCNIILQKMLPFVVRIFLMFCEGYSTRFLGLDSLSQSALSKNLANLKVIYNCNPTS